MENLKILTETVLPEMKTPIPQLEIHTIDEATHDTILVNERSVAQIAGLLVNFVR